MTPITVDAPPKVMHLHGHRKPRNYYHDCGRFIMRAVLMPGCYIEHRCGKCGRMCIITFEPNLPTHSVQAGGNGNYDLHEDKPATELEQKNATAEY